MAQLVVLLHSVKTSVKIVLCVFVKLCQVYLAVHLVLQTAEQTARSALYLQLEIYELVHVFIVFLRICCDKVCKTLSFDILRYDRPSSVYPCYLVKLRDIKPCFLYSGMVQRFVQYVCL